MQTIPLSAIRKPDQAAKSKTKEQSDHARKVAQRMYPENWEARYPEAMSLLFLASQMKCRINDAQLIDWKRGRGPFSASDMENNKARIKWLQFAHAILEMPEIAEDYSVVIEDGREIGFLSLPFRLKAADGDVLARLFKRYGHEVAMFRHLVTS